MILNAAIFSLLNALNVVLLMDEIKNEGNIKYIWNDEKNQALSMISKTQLKLYFLKILIFSIASSP